MSEQADRTGFREETSFCSAPHEGKPEPWGLTCSRKKMLLQTDLLVRNPMPTLFLSRP